MTFSADALSTVNAGLSLVTALAAIGWGLLMVRMKGEFSTRADAHLMAAQIADLGARCAKLEAEMRLLPGHETVQKLTERVGVLHSDFRGMHAGLEGVAKRLEALTHQIEIVQRHLLDQPRGGGGAKPCPL